MATYDMGVFIRQIRRERGITQEQLCTGLCSKSTLSKIERGLYTPPNYLFNALMERLGCFSRKYFTSFLGKDDFALWQSREALTGALYQKDTVQAEGLINKLWNAKGFDEGLGLQFLHVCKVVLALIKAENKKETPVDFAPYLNWAYDALKITIPDFDENRISEYMLSYEELLAINCIANIALLRKNYEKAAFLFQALKECQDKFCLDQSEKAKCYPGILANLVYCLYELGRYEDAIELCILGRRFCMEWGKALEILSITESYGKCLIMLGKKDEARPMLRHVYGTALTLGQTGIAEELNGYFSSIYGESLK